MPGKTTLVTTAAALVKAAKTAAGGDTILLAPGDYGPVVLYSIQPKGAGVVTIKSADANNDAVFTYLSLNRVSNFLVEDIDVHHVLGPGGKEWDYAMSVGTSTNVTLSGIDFTGSLDGNRNNDGNGLSIGGSSRVTVLDSRFREFNNAVTVQRSDNVIFAGNSITETREGVQIAQLNHGLFERNLVTNIAPDISKGDHTDGFQVHSGGTFLGSNDLAFRSNVIITGPGGAQAIFVTSQKGGAGVVHTNVSIENNYIESNMRNAIGVGYIDNLVVRGNTVRDGLNANASNLMPGIVSSYLNNAIIEKNIATLFVDVKPGTSTNTVWRDNVDVWDKRYGKGVAGETIFAQAAGSTDLDFSSVGVKAGSIADTLGAGFRGVSGIGNLAGSVAAQMVSYLPQLDSHFATSFHV